LIHSVEHYSAENARARALALGKLAILEFNVGDPERGIVYGEQALAAAPSKSRRVLDGLTEIRRALVDRHTRRQQFEQTRDGIAQTAHRRLAVAHRRIRRDAIKSGHASIIASTRRRWRQPIGITQALSQIEGALAGALSRRGDIRSRRETGSRSRRIARGRPSLP
jgi:hypothetical protein